MRLDVQTLRDLGILHTPDSQKSLLEWANFARTRGGEHQLRLRFQNPPSTPGALAATQAAVRFLARHDAAFERLLDGSNWLAIERYLQHSQSLPHSPQRVLAAIDGAWHALRHADALEQIRIGLATLQRQVHHAHAVVADLRPLSPPPAVDRWLSAMEETLALPVLSSLAGRDVHRRSAGQAVRLDGLLRDRENREARELARLVYEIDMLCSLARATREHHLVLPEFVGEPEGTVEIEGLYHPFVRNPVPNPLSLSCKERLLFVTGPNMAGKSTYLKAAGVAVFLAHVGMGVPAAAMRLTPFDCLFSGIDTTDNVVLGESYFFREVRRVRQLAQLLADGRLAFVLFDEMFKGTNLKDASDASVAVLSRLVASENSRFLVASHIAELGEPLSALGCIGFAHFAAALDGAKATFEYRLRPGVSEQRLGMYFLERENVLTLLDRLPGAAEARSGNRSESGLG